MQTEMEDEAYAELTSIQKFFFGRNIFITGATGFVGKVLVEKLLRCCPGIGTLYLLLRPKKGKTTEERMDKLFKVELFKSLSETYPRFRDKVHIIDGDIMQNRLGIAEADWELLQREVSVVFHSAARVQFNDPLQLAVEHNLCATMKFMDMCHELPHLVAVVHVSTSYVQREPDGSVLEEIPTPKLTPKQILDALEWMDENCQLALTDYLLEGKLTTYLVTKALGEVVVSQKHGNLPTAIVRPCNISPTCRDPIPGWADSIQGISGLFLAGAKGVLRTLRSVEGLKLNIVPVDLVVNAIIATAWHVAKERPSSVYIVNSVIDYHKLPYADQDILAKVLEKRTIYPLSKIFRYPDFTVYYKWLPYKIHALIDQWIPAYILDFFLYIFTGQTVLVRVYKKIEFLYDVFLRLGRTPWICRMENYYALQNSLSGADAEIFFLNVDDFDWDKYIDNCMMGGRKFIAHEDPSNIPYAKKKAYIWWLLTTILKWFIILFLLYYFLPRSIFNTDIDEEHIFDIQSSRNYISEA